MPKEYGTKLTLKDNFTAVIQKAISATEALKSKLESTEKALNKMGDKKVRIKAQLDSSVNSSLNKLADKIPKDKTIHIKAKDEVTRSVTNMKRDIFKMGNDIGMGMRDPFKGFSRSAMSATSNIGLMRSAAQDLARSMATSHVAAQMAGNSMAASAAAGVAASRVAGTKANGIKPTVFYKGSRHPHVVNKSRYPDDQIRDRAGFGHGDVEPDIDLASRTKTIWDENYADMIRNQKQVMKKQFGKKNYLPNHQVFSADLNEDIETEGVKKRLGRGSMAYYGARQAFGNKLGEAKMKLDLVTSAAEKKLNAFKSKISKSKGAEMLVRAKFAGERGMYGFKNMTATIGAKFKDMGAKSGINSLLSSIKNKTVSIAVKANVSSARSAINSLKNSTETISMVGGAAAAAGGVKSLTGAFSLEDNSVAIEHAVKYANTKQVSLGKASPKSNEQVKAESDAYLKKLRKYAIDTPFGDNEVIQAGFQAVNLANGDTKKAEDYVKVAGDMSALTPGKDLKFALDSISAIRRGEFDAIQQFVPEMTAEKFKGLIGKGENDDLSGEETQRALDILVDHKLKNKFAGGTAKKAETTTGKLSSVTGAAEGYMTDIGTMFTPGIKDALDTMANMVNTYGPIIQAALKPIADAFNALMKTELGSKIVVITVAVAAGAIAFGAFFAAVSLLATPLGMIVKGFSMLMTAFKTVSTVIKVVRTAMLGLNLAMLANPVTWVILGIIALIAAGVAMYVYWDEIKQFFLDMWVGPSKVIDGFIAFLKEAFDIGFNFLLGSAKTVLQFFTDLWYNPETAFSNYLNNMKNTFGPVADWLIEKWQKVCDFFSTNVPQANANVSFYTPGGGGGGDDGGSFWGGRASERAVGMEYIPYNGYQISAHRGEAILTRTEADQWRAGKSGGAGGVVINIHDPVVREESDLHRLGTMLAQTLSDTRSNMGAVPA